MSRYNKRVSSAAPSVLNFEGDKAYAISPEFALYCLVTTCTVSDKFYEDADSQLGHITVLVGQCDPLFVAALAVYARKKMYLRTIPLILCTELAKIHSGDNLVSRMVYACVDRADEICELLAVYANMNERETEKKGDKVFNKLSNQIKKGLGRAFSKFDEYQFSKYEAAGRAVTMKQALEIVHPKPETDEQSKLFQKILKNELETAYTWENALKAVMQGKTLTDEEKVAVKSETWEKLIDTEGSGELPYMALLRNLHGILTVGVSADHIKKIVEKLTDPKRVAKAKQLPFRYFSAYSQIREFESPFTGTILDALDKAMITSAMNIQGYDENTTVCIACDVSGSMQSTISQRSKIQNYDIGLVLGMTLQSRCKSVVTGMFGDSWKAIAVPKTNILPNVEEFHRREGEVGYSTNGHLVLSGLQSKGIKADKIMMFTDCQMWNSYGSSGQFETNWKAYKAFNPEAKLYLFDLSGYGHTPVEMRGDDVYLIAGWSDRVFDMLHAIDNKNPKAIIDEVRAIDF